VSDLPCPTLLVSMLSDHSVICSLSIGFGHCRSRNCCIELAAAILTRGENQRTWVLLSDEATAGSDGRCVLAVAAELQAAGMRVFRNGDTLLRDLSALAYRASGGLDVQRCVQWFRETSAAVPHLARDIRLPAPGRFKPGSPLGPAFSLLPHGRGRGDPTPRSLAASQGSFRWRPPRDAVFAGSRFLSADGLELGYFAAFTFQQIALLLLSLAYLIDVVFIFRSAATVPGILFAGFDSLAYVAYGGVVTVLCLAVPVILLVPLRIFGDLDARARHSDLLHCTSLHS
jgi:hypothetical protein